MENLTNLYLNFMYNKLSFEVMEFFGKGVSKFQKLRELILDLSYNRINDEGIKVFCEDFNLYKLEYLELNFWNNLIY